MQLTDLFNDVKNLNTGLSQILHDSKFQEYYDLSEYDIDNTNPDDLLLEFELYSIMEKLSSVNRRIEYLKRPVAGISTLYKQPNGRYAYVFDGATHELTCGCGVEVLVYDGYTSCNLQKDVYSWVISSIEANENGYYLVDHSDVELDGLRIRIRA